MKPAPSADDGPPGTTAVPGDCGAGDGGVGTVVAVAVMDGDGSAGEGAGSTIAGVEGNVVGSDAGDPGATGTTAVTSGSLGGPGGTAVMLAGCCTGDALVTEESDGGSVAAGGGGTTTTVTSGVTGDGDVPEAGGCGTTAVTAASSVADTAGETAVPGGGIAVTATFPDVISHGDTLGVALPTMAGSSEASGEASSSSCTSSSKISGIVEGLGEPKGVGALVLDETDGAGDDEFDWLGALEGAELCASGSGMTVTSGAFELDTTAAVGGFGEKETTELLLGATGAGTSTPTVGGLGDGAAEPDDDGCDTEVDGVGEALVVGAGGETECFGADGVPYWASGLSMRSSCSPSNSFELGWTEPCPSGRGGCTVTAASGPSIPSEPGSSGATDGCASEVGGGSSGVCCSSSPSMTVSTDVSGPSPTRGSFAGSAEGFAGVGGALLFGRLCGTEGGTGLSMTICGSFAGRSPGSSSGMPSAFASRSNSRSRWESETGAVADVHDDDEETWRAEYGSEVTGSTRQSRSKAALNRSAAR